MMSDVCPVTNIPAVACPHCLTERGVEFVCIECHAHVTRYGGRCLSCQVLHDTKLQGDIDRLTNERDAARAVVKSLAPTEAGAWAQAWEEMRDLAAKLERERDRLRVLLRQHEWADPYCCLTCGQRPAQGHAPDCRLAAALKS
jgi:hypothetical protein